MRILRIDEHSRFRQLVGVGGLGTGLFFALEGDHTLGRNESRLGRLLDVRDYCKLHIVSHYVAKLLGADQRLFPVVPLGKVGDDAAGSFVIRALLDVGIDTRYVKVIPGKPTLFSVCFQYPNGSGGNITSSNSAAADLSEEDIDNAGSLLDSIGSTTIALLVPEVALSTRRRFLCTAKQKGAFCVSSFVSGEISDAKRLGMFDHLDMVSLNEEEAAETAGTPFIADRPDSFLNRLVRLLASEYPRLSLIISAGKNGAFFANRSAWSYSPAPRVTVASTAGAGDCLLAGILAGMAAGIPLPHAPRQISPQPVLVNALDFGVLLASYKVSSPHTIHPGASLDELLQFARQLGISIVPAIEQLVAERDVVKAGG